MNNRWKPQPLPNLSDHIEQTDLPLQSAVKTNTETIRFP